MTRFVTSLVFLFVAASFTLPGYAARVVETTGSAPIENGALVMAREKAVKSAMQQAAMQSRSRVESTALTSSNVLIIESSRVDAAGMVEDVAVLEEWREDDLLFVRIRARVSDEAAKVKSPAKHYRKKVAVLQFDVVNRAHIHDMPGLEQAWPRELARRLNNSGNFLGIDGSVYLVSDTNPGFRFDYPETYATLAEKLGAQVIVSGVVRDLAVDPGIIYDKRNVEVELFIHDGLSGARIAQYRFSERADKSGYVRNHTALFSNAEFLNTPFGQVLDRIVDRQAEMIENDLDKIPFTARIVEIKGNEIIFNAGAASLVRAGDVLMTYQLSPDPLRYRADREYLGYREKPVATLSVQQVQPLFAVGKLEIEKADLYPGDIIRFGL